MARLIHAQDFAEYCAALPTSAVYNVHRKANAAFLTPDHLMLMQRTRLGARSAASVPMRYALPGERPPSTRPPDTHDDMIDRFDNFASRLRQSGGRIN